jgi:DNA-binding NtrC family response regulator
MPARVVIVLDDPASAEKAVAILKRDGIDAMALAGPMVALDALEGAHHVELLVTSLQFAPGKPHGLALARMARTKRPLLKVMFVGDPGLAQHTAGLGEFMAWPVELTALVRSLIALLEEP